MSSKRKICKMVVVFLMLGTAFFGMLHTVHAAEGMHVEYHTQEEIKSMYQYLNPANREVLYEEKPSAASPYALGKVSSDSLQNGLNTLNFIRYVAGIPYNVQIKEEYQNKAQAAALVNEANGCMTHYPSTMPSGMEKELYDLGCLGARSSNLGWGYRDLYSAIVQGWMADEDDSNIDRVGHRRWCLSPRMSFTGFGVVNRMYAMYAFDKSNTSADQYGVAWPAQNMPYEFWDESNPWSISMGRHIDGENVSVILTRKNDGRTWNFSYGTSEGDFFVNNNGYGQPGCIIFRPAGIRSYHPGDSFHVSIKGTDLNVSYDVNFFAVHEHRGGQATCLNKAACAICGEKYGETGNHNWKYRSGESGKHKKYCQYCDKYYTEKCSYVNGICTMCGGEQPLTAPAMIKAVSADYNSIKVTWRKVPNARSYTLYYKGAAASKWKTLKTGIRKTEYLHVSSKKYPLVTGSEYVYMVKAVKGKEISKGSKTSAKVKPVLPPTQITSVKKASYGMKIKWNPVKGAAFYQIQSYQKGKWKTIGVTKKTSFADKAAKKKGNYKYRIRACREKTYSAWSPQKTGKR